MQTIDALDSTLRSYLNPAQAQQVRRAYYFAEQAHFGQIRRSGEPYVTHPLAVAGILADMHMDHQSLMAAMLHDVIEDTGIEKDSIGHQFGPAVAELVDGVSKLTQMEFGSLAEKQAENFQKMALAMARDIRVILVKLADRLHNMRTLGVLPQDKARRIARETLEIYAPIAMRLGMNAVRMEFEDLGFSALYPMRASRIQAAIRASSGYRKELVDKIRHQIESTLEQEGHDVEVIGREKHLYSIYSKMKSKKKSFSEIMDIYAFRIIVDSVDTCYRVLGSVHSLYKPVPGEFSDYIAIPKANGYQSLHTVLMGMHGVPIEIQIRTREMEEMANNGIAAHWLYKSDSQSANGSHARAREWVQGLLEMQQRAGNSLEFIESVKIDLFPDEIYVFTPKGRILELPRGATAVDFAFAVHTDVGNSCVACRINRRLAPLSEPLQSGQTVEILTAPGARPNPSWFNYAVTAKARTNIRHFLKHQTREDSIALGKRLLERALQAFDSSLEQLPADRLQDYLSGHDYSALDDLLEDIARGNRLPPITAQQILGEFAEPSEPAKRKQQPVAIRGTEGFMVTYARCCHPIPGDPIEGYLSSEKGVVVHRERCKNLTEMRENRERLVALRWDDHVQGEYLTELRIEVENRRGMIAVLATRINSMGVNIEKISTEDKDYQFTYVDLAMQVNNRIHLANIMKRLRTVNSVRRVSRLKNEAPARRPKNGANR
ncbi:bifunctional GTP diphosphokinase/guanosine-3',5'-bis pyrophosphate 3'-pyrophosphohydrolase [Haliea sp.]|jgi:RelA/SpoT family (p)ppGpp synthetase|uniref:bifunctional GTP diphosphokinase/guanosine-3',5'-bis pyrophosphate 3'-pyrophosphohydrolase n=1 Tax=Haliea TaxID=475794 RepID=UPI000C408EF5|nr:bifunctional GTP diphosphokinase/guanosine-3',5'-bis pyrophosphate 3'-pyrophosphohydrolase [Haliea sp.]HAN68591.1 guanosine-3',5'-bis(diphosphate) 3'-diphosphatase [Halieaceae bacterium]MAD63320.1 bifunctional GTP diphosphokinase/guanosine-3',5'-bis(diphosphate) 3'-diphosphatase [Haliea sp.]MAY91857.1 bifunctional GTP diphosphokinase/guanosine-3',5'-bis(diphosphate) 3'-diphosphatase [Haliea sp.]MBK41781.1 bifunctional GTP diphosphokinase/guanosine-3',5'-bis(diphosphate) 3'-diphosphatase [Hal|tara:strand:+ start:770 stop:2923 length:2154 start_codon:yes stop_codon:yes gene_type:complete